MDPGSPLGSGRRGIAVVVHLRITGLVATHEGDAAIMPDALFFASVSLIDARDTKLSPPTPETIDRRRS